ncbi:Eaa1 [Klebsiella pneumoniae]|nr:Eaa1 [Klebsiella pneumoniae]
MTKSTITREQITSWMNDANYALEEPLNADDAAAARAILAMGHELLAAMDSESECLPLDYLQGHKDGLEWAARLAEANHPDTGDWLYDDPIELAKAIRKGPDIPPAQPVADSDPVIIVGDDGGDALSYRRLIQSFEPGTKLYRHAQPALVIPDEMTAEQAYEIGDYHGDPVDVFARGANWMRQHIIDSTLAAARQEVKHG